MLKTDPSPPTPLDNINEHGKDKLKYWYPYVLFHLLQKSICCGSGHFSVCFRSQAIRVPTWGYYYGDFSDTYRNIRDIQTLDDIND
jgi:hypothetical protein